MKQIFVILSCLALVVFFAAQPASGQNSANRSPVADSGLITFRVDMTQWTAKGLFHPATDSIDMPGTMNNWKGTNRFLKVDTTLVYQIVLKLNYGAVHQFRFRINGDSNRMEINSHIYRVPNDTTSVKYMYNNYDPATVPITLRCKMYYQIKASHFNPSPYNDYLDVAGTFNGYGAYDVLFDRGNDSIYQITLNLPKSLISDVVPIAFKFRINGNWTTAELANAPFRTFFLKDTVGGFQNVAEVWYDDKNPAVPAPPIVYNLHIQGNFYAKQVLTCSYSYEDYNLLPEGKSLYRWYIADTITDVNLTPVGDSTVNYLVDSIYTHKFLAFEITPVAKGSGDSLIGKTVRIWLGKLGGVGIGTLEKNEAKSYPNPASVQINFDHLGNTLRIEIYAVTGKEIAILNVQGQTSASFDVSGLSKGIYLLRFVSGNGISTSKFIKN